MIGARLLGWTVVSAVACSWAVAAQAHYWPAPDWAMVPYIVTLAAVAITHLLVFALAMTFLEEGR